MPQRFAPKNGKVACVTDARDLRASKLKVLRALAPLRGGMTAARLGAPGALLQEMRDAGLVAASVAAVEGVGDETTWRATDAGRNLLSGAAALTTTIQPEMFEKPDIGALVPGFGINRMGAKFVAEQCRRAVRVLIPFCGSLSEVPEVLSVGVRAVTCNDAHRHLVNLARVMADTNVGTKLYRRLRRQPFAPETLTDAQRWCREHEPSGDLDLESAFHYFVTAWMGRSAQALTKGEFKGGLCVRWKGEGSGGESSLRFSGAVWSIRSWRKVLERCTFWCQDAFEFIEHCLKRCDDVGAVLYADPPWVDAGNGYAHNFSDGEEGMHARLSSMLDRFELARVVLRIGGHPLIERLYPQDRWRWLAVGGRTQSNAEKVEWLIVKNGRTDDAEEV